MGDVRWYRVVDPLSPLFGSDVRGWRSEAVFGADDALVVEALRRVDISMGNRPFQLVAPEGENLGIAIRTDMLEESPIQDDIVELAADRPFGISIDEGEMTRDDGYTLTIARFERAVQVALSNEAEGLIATKTFVGDPEFAGEQVLDMFEEGVEADTIAYELKRRD